MRYFSNPLVDSGKWKFIYYDLDSAFYNVSITTISIPLSVTTIGYNAFKYSKNLTTVNYGGTSSDKDSISIGTGNDYLLNATWNCSSGGSGCQHTNTRTNYNWLGDWDSTGNYDQHLKQVICADCSTSDYYEVLSEDPENCTFENGVCIYCGHTQGATSASRQPIDMEVEPTYYSSNSKMVETKNFTPVFYNKKRRTSKNIANKF